MFKRKQWELERKVCLIVTKCVRDLISEMGIKKRNPLSLVEELKAGKAHQGGLMTVISDSVSKALCSSAAGVFSKDLP